MHHGRDYPPGASIVIYDADDDMMMIDRRLICAVVPRDVVLEHHVQTLIRLHRSRYRKTQFDLRSRVSNAKKPRSMKGSDVAVQLAEAQLREAAIESVLRGCYGGPPARDRSTGCTSYTPY